MAARLVLRSRPASPGRGLLADNAISCERRPFFAARDDSPQHRFTRRSSRATDAGRGHAQDRALRLVLQPMSASAEDSTVKRPQDIVCKSPYVGYPEVAV